jgi:GntR family transcriptional regulator / MocR family aminotransferase
LQRLRRRNASRRAALLEAIAKHLGDRVDVTGEGAGAQVVLWPRNKVQEKAVVAAAARKGVGIYGIAHCWLKQPGRTGFILGYARLSEQEIREGVRILGSVL